MRKLKNIELSEISLVDKPANKKKFLFAKRKQLWPSLVGKNKNAAQKN